MGNSATSESITPEEQQASSGGGGCLYRWNCTDWSECLPSMRQIRECTNTGTCPDKYKTPETEQNCTYIPFSPKDNKEEGDGVIISVNLTKKNRMFVYFVILSIILSVTFYLKRAYFNKVAKMV
ncbi:MAG: hypothetical protein KKD18_01060 [Nanoarchaeota archaeon]|nr:hypothetical protein [Nanoarchaeota archaeon]MBU0976984.1 hypothetical protein [Nanoarchaeota archaeon]